MPHSRRRIGASNALDGDRILRLAGMKKTLIVALGLLLALPSAYTLGQNSPRSRHATTRDFAKWEKEIAAYEASDQKYPPLKGGVVFIGLNPAPARWGEGDKNRELNRLIRESAPAMPRVGFVDAYDISLTSDGRPRVELFVKDRLHFSPEGYKLLAARVRPFLAQ